MIKKSIPKITLDKMNDDDSKNSTKSNRTNKSNKSDNIKGSTPKRKVDAVLITKTTGKKLI